MKNINVLWPYAAYVHAWCQREDLTRKKMGFVEGLK